MEGNYKNMRLKEWLIAQIESGKYAGVTWENQEKTMFRIPWKHAAKQDYNQHEDAALFKAWAMFKGKYQEGKDRADPSVWKTRLRCALNKSTDFQEVPERSQLDISEPYKVYRIQAEEDRGKDSSDSPVIFVGSLPGASGGPAQKFGSHINVDGERREKTDSQAQQCSPACRKIWTEPTDCEGRENLKYCTRSTLGEACLEAPVAIVQVTYPAAFQITDFRLQVRLYYLGQLVQDFTTSTPEGCRILHGTVQAENEKIYGPCAVEQIHFPPPQVAHLPPKIGRALTHLLPHLERGVLVWAAPDGVFIKRFCQGRVYWSGPQARNQDQPNKLEREKTCKLLDMAVFNQEFQQYLERGGPAPRFEVDLCFGEEFPEPGKTFAEKLITAHVETLFVKELVMQEVLVLKTRPRDES
ncbi:interferon regulatory factor 4-like [Megalops cyprinoides]|uniref:interferon regulatory factor 4-like n=1 Tax=Megalops cyprinoides TaxID=118141 RepID=UPI001863E85B|nr:interferon regulatory factor 4-like [Megalops cyprinoides]